MKNEIDELAKDICKGGCCSLTEWEDCLVRNGDCPTPKRLANHLHNIGYRKTATDRDAQTAAQIEQVIKELSEEKV